MKDEIRRILRLVEDGKISSADAADLIDALQTSDYSYTEEAVPKEEPVGVGASAGSSSGATSTGEKSGPKPPFDLGGLFDKLTKEANKVNWGEIADSIRCGTQKGVETLKSGFEDLQKSGFGLTLATTNRDGSLPLSDCKGKTLVIENRTGNVEVVAGKQDPSVKYVAKFRGLNPDDTKAKAESFSVSLEESEHSVTVKIPDMAGVSADVSVEIGSCERVEIRCETGNVVVKELKAPGRFTTNTGDISIADVNGLVEVKSETGDIQVARAECSTLTVDSRSGDIRIMDADGTLNVRSASGNVFAQLRHNKNATIDSASGNIELDCTQSISGAISARTVSGNTKVMLVDGCDCRVKLSTLRGEVICGLPLDDAHREAQLITGKLGSGTGSLDVSAVTGNVSLAFRDQTIPS